MLYFNGLGIVNIKFPIIKILPAKTGLPAAYDSHTRHIRNDSIPEIASFSPSKVSDYLDLGVLLTSPNCSSQSATLVPLLLFAIHTPLYIVKKEMKSITSIATFFIFLHSHSFLFRMIRVPITPGIHPHRVSRNTMVTEPHPRSSTASGGKIIANSTWRQDISSAFLD